MPSFHVARPQSTPEKRTPDSPASASDSVNSALLTPALYYADGQILDEDYEYGSFLQTKMYSDGVRCVDCHNPHTLKLKAEGNALCVQCHSERADRRFPKLIPKVYDTPAHHFHKADSPGAQCVNCHMPAKNYMVVDPRRDHSFRIPRPDLSVKIGTPNACTTCHKEKSPQWAADAVAKWFGPNRRQESHYGEVIAAGRAGKPEAASQLIALVRDKNISAIVRATAVELLRRYGPEVNQAIIDATKDSEPLVRVTAVDGLDRLTPDEKLSVVAPLVADPIRAVRIQAARVLTGAPIDRLEPVRRREFDSALSEYKQAQIYNADIPSGNLNLAKLAWLDRAHLLQANQFEEREKRNYDLNPRRHFREQLGKFQCSTLADADQNRFDFIGDSVVFAENLLQFLARFHSFDHVLEGVD
jgi:predicted CXXCH cytochrome family protein